MVLVLRNETQPKLYRLGVSVLDLDHALMRHTLEVLHGLLVDERTLDHGPARDLPGERNRARCGEVAVVSGAHGEIAHEFEVADTVGAELKIAHGEAMGRFAAEGFVIEGLEGEREAGARIFFLIELIGFGGGFVFEGESGGNTAGGTGEMLLSRWSGRRREVRISGGEAVLFDFGLAPVY